MDNIIANVPDVLGFYWNPLKCEGMTIFGHYCISFRFLEHETCDVEFYGRHKSHYGGLTNESETVKTRVLFRDVERVCREHHAKNVRDNMAFLSDFIGSIQDPTEKKEKLKKDIANLESLIESMQSSDINLKSALENLKKSLLMLG